MQKGIYLLIILSVPLIFLGLINRIKAIWGGRQGASIWQPIYDFIKLLRKGEVISKTTSFVFRITPSINIAAMIFAALIIPLPQQKALIAFPGDFVLFAYVLGLAKFMQVIAAMDTGSPFEGMGAAREVTFSNIVEPAFFMLIGSLALITGETSFESIFARLNYSAGYTVLIKLLCLVSFFIMLITEGARVPVDDPNTHLELTMIHEVMILDYSGPDLAFLQYAVGLKMVLIATLVLNLLLPSGIGMLTGILFFLTGLAIIAVLVGLIESLYARLRMSHVPQFIFLMMALSLTTFAVVIFFLYGGN
ncbi:NADH-quinone oxidoreductase subunit H [candidate division KSB1 bacterium]|nr:NADH-quinone oxidoreductase subunit H [candidate division KSB1 bacterium]